MENFLSNYSLLDLMNGQAMIETSGDHTSGSMEKFWMEIFTNSGPWKFSLNKKIEIKLRTRSKTIFINLRSSKKVLVRNIKTRMENGLEKKGQLVI